MSRKYRKPDESSRANAACAIMLFVLLVTFAPAVSADTSFILASTRGSPGTTVAVPVILQGETNVVAWQADVLFDNSSLFSGAVSAGEMAANHVISTSEPASGVRRLLCYSLRSNPLSNGVVAVLNFSVPAGIAQNALRLSLSNVLLVTAAPSEVPAINGNGLIVLNPILVRPDGKTDFFLNAKAGQTNVIQASTNLEQWIDLGAVVPTGTIVEFTDTNSLAFPYRFYRTFQR